MTCFVIRRSTEPCEYKDIPVVADGVVFPDGRTVVAWRGSTTIYDTVRDMFAVHGHDSVINSPDLSCEMDDEIVGEDGAKSEAIYWWLVDPCGAVLTLICPATAGRPFSLLDAVPEGSITIDSMDDDGVFTARIEDLGGDLGDFCCGKGTTREAALGMALQQLQQRYAVVVKEYRDELAHLR